MKAHISMVINTLDNMDSRGHEKKKHLLFLAQETGAKSLNQNDMSWNKF